METKTDTNSYTLVSNLNNLIASLFPFLFSREANTEADDIIFDRFQDGFVWGAATSAYQTEGAYQKDGKGQLFWLLFLFWSLELLSRI